jgi:hypothetical protein
MINDLLLNYFCRVVNDLDGMGLYGAQVSLVGALLVVVVVRGGLTSAKLRIIPKTRK